MGTTTTWTVARRLNCGPEIVTRILLRSWLLFLQIGGIRYNRVTNDEAFARGRRWLRCSVWILTAGLRAQHTWYCWCLDVRCAVFCADTLGVIISVYACGLHTAIHMACPVMGFSQSLAFLVLVSGMCARRVLSALIFKMKNCLVLLRVVLGRREQGLPWQLPFAFADAASTYLHTTVDSPPTSSGIFWVKPYRAIACIQVLEDAIVVVNFDKIECVCCKLSIQISFVVYVACTWSCVSVVHLLFLWQHLHAPVCVHVCGVFAEPGHWLRWTRATIHWQRGA